ncbi:MAG: hypothetical protein ACI9MB_005032, partial [Verrucomicrobiales bacterium]
MSFSNQEPLPDAARESLRDRGGRLLGQLESMRQLSDERIVIGALDPEAELALRQQGESFLSDLQNKRAELASERPLARPTGRQRRFPLGAIAACLSGLIGCVWLFDGAGSSTPQKITTTAHQPSPSKARSRTKSPASPEANNHGDALLPNTSATIPEP